MVSFYDLLGVRSDADGAELHRAYRAAARRLHPDVTGESDAMRELNEAWAVLRDPDLRAEYDSGLELGSGWDSGEARARPPAWVRRAPLVAILAVLLAIFVLTAYAAVPTTGR